MTVNEFSDKYDVPYRIVYEATYKISPISPARRDREFHEKDMLRSVKQIAEKRFTKHKTMAKKQIKILENLKKAVRA